MLSGSAWSSEMTQQVAARKPLAARSWKLIRDTDINIFCIGPTAVASIKNFHPFNIDCCSVVNGKAAVVQPNLFVFPSMQPAAGSSHLELVSEIWMAVTGSSSTTVNTKNLPSSEDALRKGSKRNRANCYYRKVCEQILILIQ